MIRRDYILELVERFANVIARVLFLKESARYEEAYKEIDDACRQFFSLAADDLRTFSTDDLVRMLASGGTTDAGKCMVAADLLSEMGDITERAGDPQESDECYRRALALYLVAVAVQSSLDAFELPRKILAASERADAATIPDRVWRSLLAYLEEHREYAEAENILYELVDAGREGAVEAGIAFYERLDARSDEELEQGGLPRAEVREGLESLRKDF